MPPGRSVARTRRALAATADTTAAGVDAPRRAANPARRTFVGSAICAVGGSALLGRAAAQSAWPVEGTHYVRLGQPVPPALPGKVDVVEFFWYGCPHCHAFEPALDAWQTALPADVVFRRVPIAFSAEPFTAHQRLFYALEALGQLPTMHRRVFDAIHTERMRLAKPDEIAAFVALNGLDAAKFQEAYDSFSVQTKAAQARQVAQAYRVDAVPALGVQGRFYTTGTMAGTNDRMTGVADALVARIRKGG